METGGTSQPTESSKRRRRRKNKSGLKLDNTKQTILENVPKTMKKQEMQQTISKNIPKTMKKPEMHLRPSEIRYSQGSISCKFSDDTNIGSLLDDIMFGRCFASAVPVIEVSMIKNHWVSADNRRLWVFKQLEILSRIETIKVKVVKKIYNGKLTSDNAGRTVVIRGIPSGSVYVKLNEMYPDQYPMKSKKNRRRRKANSKKNDNSSAKINPTVPTAEPPTKCLQASDIADTDKSNIVQTDVFRNYDTISFQENISTDQYSRASESSEYEYSEEEYSEYENSESEESDDDNTNDDNSSSDGTSANATDANKNLFPNASVTGDGATLSRDFSNLQLHQSSSNCHYSTAENNVYQTTRQTQNTSKSNGFISTNILLSSRSDQAMASSTAFQQRSMMASPNTDMGVLNGQDTSVTNSFLTSSRNNSDSYCYIERSTVAKQAIAKQGTSARSLLLTESRNNTRSFGHFEKPTAKRKQAIVSQGNVSSRSQHIWTENTHRLPNSVIRDNTPKNSQRSNDLWKMPDDTCFDRYDSSFDECTNFLGEYSPSGSKYCIADLCSKCERERDECICFLSHTSGADSTTLTRKLRLVFPKKVDVRKPDILDSIFDGITTVGNFLKKLF